MADYALFLSTKLGKTDEALEYFTKARNIYKKIATSINNKHPSDKADEENRKTMCEAAILLFSTAVIHIKRKNSVAAILAYQRGIDELRGKLINGPDENDPFLTDMRRRMINALFKLGGLHLKRGNLEAALGSYEDIIANFGGNKNKAFMVEVGKAHVKASTIAQSLNQLKTSVEHLRIALNIYTVKYGVSHEDTLAIATSLRQLQCQMGPTYDPSRPVDGAEDSVALDS